MIRFPAWTLVMAVAFGSAAIAVAAMLTLMPSEAPTVTAQNGSQIAISEQTDSFAETYAPQETVPTEQAATFAPPTRAAVDWAALYAQTAPSLVMIQTASSVGSGFFVSKDGHILTNLHVVDDARAVRIFTHDGAAWEANVVAKDVGNDLALVLLEDEANKLDVVEVMFGRLEDVRVGDPVAALGAPFNLPNSLSVGIVSGLERTRESGTETLEPLRDMIQTDAALNPGNSGGMLIDGRGRVIGVPTQIESPDRASIGIGFAVSADAILRSLPILLRGQDVERAYLGVRFNINDRPEVVDVTCGSPADLADLRNGDLILSINFEQTETFEDLVAVMVDIRPGDGLRIVVERDGRDLTLRTTAGAWPSVPERTGCG